MSLSKTKVLALAVGAFVLPLGAFVAMVQYRAHTKPFTLDAPMLGLFWDRAMTFQQFIDSDTSRHAQWIENSGRGDSSVRPMLERARRIPGHWKLLTVAECWCGDAVNSVPYLAKLAELDTTFELRLLRKEEAGTLLRAHLLDGRAATPLVLVLDDRFVEHGVWTEQPAALRTLVSDLEPNVSRDSLRTRVKAWYEADAGRSMLDEMLRLLENGATPAARGASR